MKTISRLLLIFLVLHCQFAKSQTSILYNKKGQLNADTTLSISTSQYKAWIYAEPNLIAYFSSIEFPLIYLENNINQKAILLVSFFCDSTEINNIKVLNDSSVYALAVISTLKKQGANIASELKFGSSLDSHGSFIGKYYTAISFEMIDYIEIMKKIKAVPIIRGTVPLISRGSY